MRIIRVNIRVMKQQAFFNWKQWVQFLLSSQWEEPVFFIQVEKKERLKTARNLQPESNIDT